jgi:putative DNA primase/helicase
MPHDYVGEALGEVFGPSPAPPKKTSELICLADVRPLATDWLWHNRIPRAAQTISTGLPGVGKSQQQCDMIGRTTTGTPWPDGSPCPKGDVILLTAEDALPQTVVPRLLAAGADMARVRTLPFVRVDAKTERAFLLTEDIDELERHLIKWPETLLVCIDPITAYLGAGKIDSHKATDVRAVLSPLAALAERRNIAIHTITHPPKASTSAIHAFIGSQAFIAAARVGYLTVEETGEDGKPTGRCLLTMVKANLGPKMPTLAYRLAQAPVGEDHRDGRVIYGSHVVWETGTVEMTADQALAATAGGKTSAASEASEFLRRTLASGPVPVRDLQAEAKAAGLSWATIRRAKDSIGVAAERKSEGREGKGEWQWVAPNSARRSSDLQDAHPNSMSVLHQSEHLAANRPASPPPGPAPDPLDIPPFLRRPLPKGERLGPPAISAGPDDDLADLR